MVLSPCRECGEPGTEAETCPYCGAPNMSPEDAAALNRKGAGLGWGFVLVVSVIIGLVCFGEADVREKGRGRIDRDYAAHPAAVECGHLMRRFVAIRPVSLPPGSELTISNTVGAAYPGRAVRHGQAAQQAQIQQPLTCTVVRTTTGWVVTRLTVASQRLKGAVTRSHQFRQRPDLSGGSLLLGITTIAIDGYELDLPRQ